MSSYTEKNRCTAEKAKKIFLQDKRVTRIILFGSVSRAEDKSNSDVDLAVEFNTNITHKDRMKMLKNLHRENINTTYGSPGRLHAVIISKEEVVLFHQNFLRDNGIVLFEK